MLGLETKLDGNKTLKTRWPRRTVRVFALGFILVFVFLLAGLSVFYFAGTSLAELAGIDMNKSVRDYPVAEAAAITTGIILAGVVAIVASGLLGYIVFHRVAARRWGIERHEIEEVQRRLAEQHPSENWAINRRFYKWSLDRAYKGITPRVKR